MAVETHREVQSPPPFCPDCGTHSCPYPDPAMHRPKSERKRRRWPSWLRLRRKTN